LIYSRFNSRHRGLSASTHSCLPGHSLVEVKTPKFGFTTTGGTGDMTIGGSGGITTTGGSGDITTTGGSGVISTIT